MEEVVNLQTNFIPQCCKTKLNLVIKRLFTSREMSHLRGGFYHGEIIKLPVWSMGLFHTRKNRGYCVLSQQYNKYTKSTYSNWFLRKLLQFCSENLCWLDLKVFLWVFVCQNVRFFCVIIALCMLVSSQA